MDDQNTAAGVIVGAIVALAILGLLLLARGTPDHGRYGESLLPAAPAVVTI
jgi:hypothetical protein